MGNNKDCICRPVTFYNDHLPTSQMGEKADFCAFGIVDGIDVGDILNDKLESKKTEGPSKTERRSKTEGPSITERIWANQKEFNSQQEGTFNAQRIYIVRDESEEEECKFWEGSERPFFFFCRIQCDGDKVQLMGDRSVLEESGSGNCSDDEIEIKTYLTYDNTDLFVVIRASKYDKGAEVINRLHSGMNLTPEKGCSCILKNSFTIMAVRYEWINKVVIPAKEIWNRDKIEKVYIRMIERPGGEIRKVEEEIKDKLNIRKEEKIGNPILGTDDEIIVLPEIGWGDFLALYDRERGLFGNRFDEDSLYNKNAAGVTTQICVKLDGRSRSIAKDEEEGDKKNTNYNDNNKKIWDAQISKLKAKLKKIKEGKECINELYIILNTLPKYSGEMFNDYIFFPLLKVLDTLLDLMIQQMSARSKILDKEPFYDFLTGFCFYTQNTMLTDRYTAQIMGFNVKIYDIPVKLSAFYNAFMHGVASVLKMQSTDESGDQELSYDFIVMPGMADMVNVVELYKGVSDKQRLMKAEIPEYSFYNVRDMLVILAHETAHYVGREMRNREERTENIISGYAHIYIKYVEHKAYLNDCDEYAWQESEGRLINLIYRYLLLECNETFLKEKYPDQEKIYQEKAEQNKKNMDYFSELLPNIHNAMVTIVKSDLGSVFTPVLRIGEDCLKKIQFVSERFIFASSEYTVVSSENVLDGLMSLYEESFADLMSIMILQMKIKEYVSVIVACSKNQNMEMEDLLQSDAMLRIAVVLGSILETKQMLGNGTLKKSPLYNESVFADWRRELREGEDGDKQSQELREGEDSGKWRQVVGAALKLWYKSICGQAGKKYEDNKYDALIYDDFIMKNASQYLKSCLEKFAENYKESCFSAKAGKLKELFQKLSREYEQSGEKQIREMVNFIESYKRELLQQITKEGNDNGDFGTE